MRQELHHASPRQVQHPMRLIRKQLARPCQREIMLSMAIPVLSLMSLNQKSIMVILASVNDAPDMLCTGSSSASVGCCPVHPVVHAGEGHSLSCAGTLDRHPEASNHGVFHGNVMHAVSGP